MKKKIVVTGGSGKVGRATIKELLAHGYKVINADLHPPKESLCRFCQIDLNNLGQVFEILQDAYAVIHLGAIAKPVSSTSEYIFRHNTMSTYNVFTAATGLKLKRVVWASSETVFGLHFKQKAPLYVPINEEHPALPESSYALSKFICEEVASQFSRWSGIPFVGLRFSNVKEPREYPDFCEASKDPTVRQSNMWAYVDVHDAAQSCRLALEAKIKGAEVFIIAAPDTIMDISSVELMKKFYPKVPIKKKLQKFDALFSIEKARKKLGYRPQHSWRDHF
jgi:nucleoside-diphosphate-sugar epimerase